MCSLRFALTSLALILLGCDSFVFRAFTTRKESHELILGASGHVGQGQPHFHPLHMSDVEHDSDEEEVENRGPSSTNVLGTALAPCCTNVRGTGVGTGFYRNGYCSTGEQDVGRHTVCVQVTDDFLAYSASVGNDLSTPVPQFLFPGLQEGDIWCLCAQRWMQAYQAGKAPKVFLQSTHEKTLDYVEFNLLRMHALDGQEADEALDELNEQRSRLNKLL